MKKLLILMLVLCIATTASAATTNYRLRVAPGGTSSSPDGAPVYDSEDWVDPGECEIEVIPSDLLWIGIYNPTLGPKGVAQLAIACDEGGNACGSWTGNWTVYVPPLPGVEADYGNTYYGVQPYGVGGIPKIDVWSCDMTDGLPATQNGVGVLDAKEFHCDEANCDVTIILLDDFGAQIDSIVIHQIPEPATMTLLGLGGLLLIRRRK